MIFSKVFKTKLEFFLDFFLLLSKKRKQFHDLKKAYGVKLDARKSVIWVCNQARLNLTSSATETRLDLILSLFFYCHLCPRYWGRQQLARVSNTQAPRLSVQWIDGAKIEKLKFACSMLRYLTFKRANTSKN